MNVNGKYYPMWGQFIEKKAEWTGGLLDETDMGVNMQTTIVDITLKPNGKDSAFFSIVGKDFTCGFDVCHGGLAGGEEGWVTFSGYGGHSFRIKKDGTGNT